MFVPAVSEIERGSERGAYHFFIGQLSSLDAATVSDRLLMPFALGVAEQVHLWGDLWTQTQWSEVTAVDTMETEEGKGSTLDPGDTCETKYLKGSSRGQNLALVNTTYILKVKKVACCVYG